MSVPICNRKRRLACCPARSRPAPLLVSPAPDSPAAALATRVLPAGRIGCSVIDLDPFYREHYCASTSTSTCDLRATCAAYAWCCYRPSQQESAETRVRSQKEADAGTPTSRRVTPSFWRRSSLLLLLPAICALLIVPYTLVCWPIACSVLYRSSP